MKTETDYNCTLEIADTYERYEDDTPLERGDAFSFKVVATFDMAATIPEGELAEGTEPSAEYIEKMREALLQQAEINLRYVLDDKFPFRTGMRSF